MNNPSNDNILNLQSICFVCDETWMFGNHREFLKAEYILDIVRLYQLKNIESAYLNRYFCFVSIKILSVYLYLIC